MKKNRFVFPCLALAVCFAACGDPNTTATTNTTTTNSDSSNATTNNNMSGTNAGATSQLPLTPADSTFVMKAATGGMMEVEAGNLAQQNAQSERVKAFGAKMVQDHQNANQELMSLASGRGLTVPTTLPPDVQRHITEMRNMKGAAFDKHYMNMMVNDHQKTVSDFQTQASGGGDTELKAWAQKMLPVLTMHRDTATAINQAIRK